MLAVVGIAADVYSVVKADRPLKQATKVVAGWAGAWAGCKVVGAGGAWVGSAVTPGMGTAIGGVVGCLVGGFIGYEGASRTAGRLYDCLAPVLNEAHLEVSARAPLFDDLKARGATGLLLPGVDGDVAGLYTFAPADMDDIVGTLCALARDGGGDCVSLGEAEFTAPAPP